MRVTKAVPIITEMMDVLSSEDAYTILKFDEDIFTEGERSLPGLPNHLNANVNHFDKNF